MKTETFYSVKDLAIKLALTPKTIYRLIREEKIPAVRIGKSYRFRPAEIEAFLKDVRVGGHVGLLEKTSEAPIEEKDKKNGQRPIK